MADTVPDAPRAGPEPRPQASAVHAHQGAHGADQLMTSVLDPVAEAMVMPVLPPAAAA